MHKVIILAYCTFSISVVATNRTADESPKISISGAKLKLVIDKILTKIPTNVNTSATITPDNSLSLNASQSSHKNLGIKDVSEPLNKDHDLGAVASTKSTNHSISREKKIKGHKHHPSSEDLKNFSMLMRIHQRITRSKDAVWATITLTVLCVLLVLAVAHSRMWKDKYHSESQGVPLPNFNERVLFKDVMERKVAFLKQFFKKKKRTKEKNVTELESLLPPSEWDD